MGEPPSPSASYVVVYPSRLNVLGYCPRKLFFDIHAPAKPRLRVRLRLLLGKVLHALRGLAKRGYAKEELVSAEVPELGVVLVGRPDGYRVLDDHVLLEEFKSTRMPSRENQYGVRAWLGDMLQAMAYSYILEKKHGKPVRAFVCYLDGRVEVKLDRELLLRYLELYKYVVGHGVLPDGRGRCSPRCQYLGVCGLVDSELAPPS